MREIGIDTGYRAIKVVWGPRPDERAMFPSVVSRMRGATWDPGMGNGQAGFPLSVEDGTTWWIGDVGRQHVARKDEAWFVSETWRVLLDGALSRVCQGSCDVRLVLGLPVADYGRQGDLTERSEGLHRFRVLDDWRIVRVDRAKVVTQPYGTFFNLLLSETGRQVANESLAHGSIGIIDIGGNTVNLLATRDMRPIAGWTTSARLGLLQALGDMAGIVGEAHPGLSPTAHEIAEALAGKPLVYHGKALDIGAYRDRYLLPQAEMIVDAVTATWEQPGRLDGIWLTGGGALLLGDIIKSKLALPGWPVVNVVNDPVYANAVGFWKYAQRDVWK